MTATEVLEDQLSRLTQRRYELQREESISFSSIEALAYSKALGILTARIDNISGRLANRRAYELLDGVKEHLVDPADAIPANDDQPNW